MKVFVWHIVVQLELSNDSEIYYDKSECVFHQDEAVGHDRIRWESLR